MYRWNRDAPIHQQLADRVVAGLLDRDAQDGAALPSVRELSKMYAVNPLTVTRALDRLRERGWIETRPGIGSVLCAGARDNIIECWRKRFLEEEWPALRLQLTRLGVSASDLR